MFNIEKKKKNTGSNFNKWNITIGWCFFFIVEMNMLYEYAGMLISETIFYNKLCSVVTCFTVLKFKIYKTATSEIDHLRRKRLWFEKITS